jgi:hypothetical protein
VGECYEWQVGEAKVASSGVKIRAELGKFGTSYIRQKRGDVEPKKCRITKPHAKT